MPKICKWGNSLGLRLPKEIAAAAGLVSGAVVRVRLRDDGSLIVSPLIGPVVITSTKTATERLQRAQKW